MTAKNLLTKLFDYQYLWALPQQVNSRPAIIRRKQIESLQEALGLSPKSINEQLNSSAAMEYLISGKFLLDRPVERNQEISDRIAIMIKQLFPDIPYEKEIEPRSIKSIFNDLFNFRFEIYKIAYPNSGALELPSPELLYSQLLQSQLQEMIKKHLGEIDETLWILLDPEKQTLSKQALVENYGYPEEDLNIVDHEWRTGYLELNANHQSAMQKEE